MLAVLLVSMVAVPAASEDNGVRAVATMTADPPINAAGWARSDVTVTLACSSGAANCRITYRLDDGPNTTYTGPFVVSADGAHYLNTTTSPNGQAGLTSDSFRVRIDRAAPQLAAPGDVTAPRAEGGGTVVRYANPPASDALSGLAALACEPASGSTFTLDETTVTCTATDVAGNSASTSFVVRLTDEGGEADIIAEATDAEGAVVHFDAEGCAPASGSRFPLGATLVECPQRSFTVRVVDTLPPTIETPANLVAEATGTNGAVVDYSPPATSDLVDGAGVATCSPAPGTVFALGMTTVTCRAVDARGNAATPKTFTVTVSDTTAPTFDALADVSVSTNASSAEVVYVTPTARDAVDGDIAAACTPASGSTFPVGTTVVTCTATDSAKNSASATFHVIVADAPTLGAVSDRVVEATSPNGAVVAYEPPSASDPTDGPLPVTCSPAPGHTFPLGDTSVICTATDSDGHRASATFLVRVVDRHPPVVTLTLEPAEPDGLDGWYVTAPRVTIAATDNGSGVDPASIAYSLDGETWTSGSSFAAFPQNASTFRARAQDNAGHLGYANRTLHVDTLPPHVTASGFTLDGASGTLTFNFSEPMNRTSVESALVNASGWTRAWSDASTQLVLQHSDVPIGTSEIVVGTGAKDAHGVPIAAAHAQRFARDAPPPLVLPPGAPVALAAMMTPAGIQLGWSPPELDNGAPVTSYQVYVNDAPAVTVTGTSHFVGALPRGAVHSFAVTAVNSAGESERARTTLPIPPVSTLAAPAPDATGWHRTPPTVELAADPAHATILVDLGAGESEYSGPFALPDGITTLRWRARAGGAEEAERVATFRVDTSAPTLVEADASGGEEILLRVVATDAHSGIAAVQATLRGEDGASFALGLTREGGAFVGRARLAPGTYEATVVVTDGAGHETRGSAGRASVLAPLPRATPAPPAHVEVPLQTSAKGDDGASGAPAASPASATPATPRSEPSSPPPRPQIVFDAENLAAGARGVIVIRLTGVDNVERIRFVLVDADRNERELVAGAPELAWDTTTVSDGFYSIEVRRAVPEPEPGLLRIQSSHETVLASARVLVRNDVPVPVEAAGAVVGAVLVTAVTHVALSAAASGASSGATSAAGGFDVFGLAQEVAIDAGQDKLRDKTRERDRRRRVRSLIATVVSLALVAPLWAFSETQGWSAAEWIRLLPIVGTAAIIVLALKYATESALARATGAKPHVRLWIAGAVSLVVSAVVFRNPFGYPAYVDEMDESEQRSTWRMQAMRAFATIAGAAAFMLPFLAFAHVLPWEFVSIGLFLAVTNVATTAMPFGPLPGRDVWRWNKLAAVGLALAGFALYITYAAALAPLWTLWALALGGGAGYAYALVRFQRTLGRGPQAVRVPVSVPVPVRTGEAPEEAPVPAPDAERRA